MNLKTDPIIFNFYKPAGISSYDVIRKLKKSLPERPLRIGHFGTLDPFAEGVLLVGLNRSTRLNEYIHQLCPKTYLAKGILGKETPSGDLTSEVSKVDSSEDLEERMGGLSIELIEESLRKEFIGEYWQKPHQFSASKFEGKKMYEYAREGVKVEKPPKRREIYDLKVKSFDFPKLDIEFKASSGTYIRTLFADCAAHLGTIGVLEGLIRTQIGGVHAKLGQSTDSLDDAQVNLRELLPFKSEIFNTDELDKFKHGNFVKHRGDSKEGEVLWGLDESEKISSLLKVDNEGLFRPIVNF